MVSGELFVHPSAIVEQDAQIGAGTRVWHHVHVRSGATIGQDCVLGKGVFVDADVRVGDRVHVQNGVSVYRGVELGDDVFVGPSAVFTNDHVPRAGGQWTLARTVVGDGASIGANATIIAPVTIGAAAMVAAGAVVVRPVVEREIVAGNPARTIGWVCRCGERRRRDAGRLRCEACGDDLEVGR